MQLIQLARLTKALLVLILVGSLMPGRVAAQVKMTGTFEASAVCPANKKLTRDNPGDIHTVIGEKYQILGKNRETASHYLLKIPGAKVTEQRWVDVDCGLAAAGDLPDAGGNDKKVSRVGAGGAVSEVSEVTEGGDPIENILAASWQPAFCATSRGKRKPECKLLTPDKPAAMQFSIHGLWPDDLHDTKIFPCYCDSGSPVSCRSRGKTDKNIALSGAVRERLEPLMPGMQSDLHLHEWSKHGSCYEDFISGPGRGADPDEYFSDTIVVMDQLNASAVRALFVDRLGGSVSFDEVTAAFDQAFGSGAGQRVVMNCQRVDGANVVSELWIGLGGEIKPDSDLADLIFAAPTTASSAARRSCKRGAVVQVS